MKSNRKMVVAVRLSGTQRAKLDLIREAGGFENDSDALRAAIETGYFAAQVSAEGIFDRGGDGSGSA